MTDIEANKKLVLRALAIITGEESLDVVNELFQPDYVDHNAAGPSGPEWVLRRASRLRETFPDLTHTVEATIAEGDLVALRTTMRGTHEGVYVPLQLPPTGKRIEIPTFHVFRVAGDKLAEHWAVRDDLGLFRQIGVVSGLPGGHYHEERKNDVT